MATPSPTKLPVPERLTAARAEAASFLRRQPRTKLVQWTVAPLLVAALVVAAVWWSRAADLELLVSGIDLATSAKVVRFLDEEKVRYQIREDGSAIMVPGAELARLRMSLAEQGVITNSLDPGEFLTKLGPGTPVATQEVLRREYLQRNLEASIRTLAAVRSADVLITPREDSPFLSEKLPAKASVVLQLNPLSGVSLQPEAIAFLVANAVEGLSLDHVTIVETEGRALWPPSGDAMTRGYSTLAEHQRALEQRYADKARALLGPVVGLENVTATATLLLDGDRVETSVETFEGEPRLRSEHAAGGRPDELTRNYEMDRTVQHRQVVSPVIRRLSLSVAVNASAAGGITAERLAEFEQMIRDAVGFDVERGDSVSVRALDFQALPELDPEIEESGVLAGVSKIEPISLLAGGLTLVLLAVLSIFIGRKWGQRAALSRVEDEAPRFDKRAAARQALRRWLASDPSRVQGLVGSWERGPESREHDEPPEQAA
ncbi:MAG: flagellar M-ring protein FliF C-terminal domain-containing protein [Acidobacteriota bacterium]